MPITVNEYFEGKGAKSDAKRMVNAHGRQADLSWSPAEFKPLNCQGIKKDGAACQAKPVKTGHLCIGHLRQAEAMTRESV